MTTNAVLERVDRTLMSCLKSVGLYPQIRRAYRRVSPKVRRAVERDRSLYAPFISDGDLVFDIGANFGVKSRAFLECGAKVVALEPNPRCHPTLALELAHYRPRFALVQKAVGEASGVAVLNVSGTDPTSSLRADWPWLKTDSLEQIEVELVTLDMLIATHGRPSFCKIDVEGYEVNCLQGLTQPIRAMSLEYHLQESDRAQACLDHLGSIGPIEVNLIGIEGDALFLPEWVTPTEFMTALHAGSVPVRGDIFVRSLSPSLS